MKKGFTLAEVLITLAVIGVVAALTIPVLVQKYQKKQLYSQFMKTYNTVTTLMDNVVAEYGEPGDWNWGSSHYNYETGERTYTEGDNPLENYILPQVKYVKECEDYKDCFASNYTYLDGEDGSSEQYPDDTLINELSDYISDEYTGSTIILADGSVISIFGDDDFVGFWIDTNGKKGPNVLGRDLFFLMYRGRESYYHNTGIEVEEWDPDGSYGDNCNPNSNSRDNGEGCASRMLQEGKMNY